MCRALLSGLPDGGERVRRKVAELESAIASKHGLEETMEQLSRMHLGEDRGPVEGRKTAKGRQCLQEGMRDEGGQGEGRGGTGEGKKDNGQRRKFVDLQAALGGWGQSLDSDDEDETSMWAIGVLQVTPGTVTTYLFSQLVPVVIFSAAHIDSKHLSTVKDPDELPVHNGAKSSLGMGPIEDVSCATHNKTDQERLAAVRQRIQQDTPRVSSVHTHCTITVTCGNVSTLCVVVIATLMCMAESPLFALQRVQTLSIDESLKLQMEQHRREEVSVCVCM